MEFLLKEAFQYLGIPYKWGGANPVEGFDCSGFVQWLLKSVALDPVGDQTAQGLFDYFERNGTFNANSPGTLCFYGKSVAQITHVAIMIDQNRVIEAGGGDSTTVSRAVAEKQSACVRIRHMTARKDLVAKIKPNYVTIGLV